MLIVVAAMASISCQKEENAPVNESKSATLTLQANVVDTKTYIEDNAVLWGVGEYVQLYYNDGANKFAKSTDESSNWSGEAQALFKFNITLTEADSYVLGGVYPASVVVENSNENPEAYKVTLPAIQNASASSYDPKAFIMLMKPENVETIDKEAHLASFRRATALNKITLTGVKENITSVEITVPEGKYLAGRRYLNLTTGESGVVYNSQTNTIKVNAEYTGNSIDVWFTSWGVELAEGDALTVKMTSAGKSYTRTIQANANGIKFVEGGLNKLSINMASAEETVLAKVAGEYLISAMPAGWMLMSGSNSGTYFNRVESNVTSSAAEVSSADFYSVEGIEDCVWVISDVEGGYAVQNKSTGKYLAWDSGNSAKVSDSAVAFSVSINDDKSGTIIDLKATERSLKYNSASPRFAFYTTAQQSLYFIPWAENPTPRISVSENAMEVESDATSVEFTYTLHNVTGTPDVTVADGATMSNVSVSADNGTVTVEFDANEEGVAKSATLVLSIEGAEDVEVVLTQKKWVDPNVIEKLTVAEFRELSDGTTVYELTGTITGIYQAYSSSYNNISFYLKDDSSDDSIVIFRMSCEGIDHTKVAVGNVITVQGPKGNYDGTAQMTAGGKCISIVEATAAPEITFEDNVVTITAVEGATIYYTLDGTVPSTSSSEYTDAIELTQTATVKAIAVLADQPQSAVAELLCKVSTGTAESVEYVLRFGSSYNSSKISSYTATWSVTCNGFTCNMANWNNNNNDWEYVKAGRKNNASVATITTAAAVSEALNTVTMTVEAVTSAKINSLKLYVSTDSNFSTKDMYTATAAKGDVVFNISNPVANAYYKIEVDCASGSSNGLITVSKVVFAN